MGVDETGISEQLTLRTPSARDWFNCFMFSTATFPVQTYFGFNLP
jgi:hypothetical protein